MARQLKSRRPYLCEYQQLAWLAWQTDAAVELFSGARAHSARMWAKARFGTFPAKLGQPCVAISAAEGKLDQTMRTGMRPYVLKCGDD